MINIQLFFYAAIIFLIFLFLLFSLIFVIKKKHLKISRWTLHQQILKIVYIASLSATSAAILIVLNSVIPIVMFPPIRISMEGVFVKISGFLFGPIIGMISALVSELVVISFIPSYFHYKYLIVLLAFGFFAGLVKDFKNFVRNPFVQMTLILSGLIVFFYFTTVFLSTTQQLHFTFNLQQIWWGIQNNFQGSFIRYGLFGFGLFGLILLLIWLSYLLVVLLKNRHNLQSTQNMSLRNLIAILILTVYSEYFISVCIAVEANRSLFGEESNDTAQILFSGALSLAPFKIVVNTIIIFGVWKSLRFFIQKESLSLNVFV